MYINLNTKLDLLTVSTQIFKTALVIFIFYFIYKFFKKTKK